MSDSYSRTEELENALETLLECFDRSFVGRPWIEVEVGLGLAGSDADGVTICEGQVNQTTADAIVIAEEVLYHEHEEEVAGGYEE